MKDKIIKGLKWFYRSYIWLFIILLGLDIATKQIIIHSGVEPYSQVADWGFVRINYILNYNAAFGLGADNTEKGHMISRVVYLIVASLATCGITAYLIIKRKSTNLIVRAALVMIITGAVGNMIDRIFYAPYHAVVDWIDFWWFWDYNFNIADSCIVIAAFMLIVYIIISEVKDMLARRKAEMAVEQAKDSEENKEKEPENSDSDNSK